MVILTKSQNQIESCIIISAKLLGVDNAKKPRQDTHSHDILENSTMILNHNELTILHRLMKIIVQIE